MSTPCPDPGSSGTRPVDAPGERNAELPRPRVTPADARQLLAEHYGIHDAELVELGSQQDRNYRVRHGAADLVLKIANPGWPRSTLQAQDHVLRRLVGRLPGLTVPVPVAPTTTVVVDGEECVVRLLTFLAGRPLSSWQHLADPVVATLGSTAATMVAALQDLSHEGFDRWLQWDLRHTRDVVESLLPRVTDQLLRDRVRSATADACDRLDELAPQLAVQPIHGDLTDDNLVAADGPDGRPAITGVIDFGDVGLGWRAAELAVAISSVLHHPEARPTSVLPAVRAFHDRAPLSDAELAALWPMVVARGAVLVVSGIAQLVIDPGNAYAATGTVRELAVFDAATSVPIPVMQALLTRHLGGTHAAAPVSVAVPVLTLSRPEVVDLSVTSELLDAGAWTEPDVEDRLLAGGDALLRHGEARLTRAGAPALQPPETVALGVTVRTADGATLRAPWDLAAEQVDGEPGAVRLTGPDATVLLRGVTMTPGRHRAGDPLTTVEPATRLSMVLLREPGLTPPRFTTPDLAPGWLAVCADPSPLLGLPAGTAVAPATRSPAELMAQRSAVMTDAQERYYGDAPPQFERGWRDLMVDVGARPYVDTINNVTMIGHGDPRVAETSARQWRLLNTNSRFHYAAIVDYSARLAALFPPELDTVMLVNSGSEAVDLALRLAKVHTSHRDVVSISEAYHGWTEASDAISTSMHDNPQAATTRPDWVHPVLAPNSFRGRYRGAEAAVGYAEDVRSTVAALVAAGRPPAAFICEAMYGKEGALALPDGYLAAAYDAVRTVGGLAIADEVQVGFGRLGEYLWGYQQQGVVPDIVTVAKAVGNGQPIGAVITRAEIADSYAREGTFFSSAGGSGVSCAVGMTVLDVWESEQMQQNSLVVGRHLRDRFARLGEQLAGGELAAAAHHGVFVGALHGLGLYQGVELVRDLTTLQPATEVTLALCDRVLDLGVIMQPTGENFNILKVKPPMCMTVGSADHFVDALTHALSAGW